MPEAGTLLGVWAAGLAAGVASGLFGVGGGILMVPLVLYLLPGTGFHEAKAVSLLVMVGSAAVGIASHRRRGSVDVRAGLLLAAGGLVGAIAGALGAELVDGRALTWAFAFVMVLTGLRMALPRAPRARSGPTRGRTPYLLALGVGAGLLSGALGVGGGIVMVPGMALAGIGMHTAVGTSLVAILGNSLGGTISHLGLGYGPSLLAIGLPLAVGALPGSLLGARLAHRMHADRLRRLFGVALLAAGVALGIDAL